MLMGSKNYSVNGDNVNLYVVDLL